MEILLTQYLSISSFGNRATDGSPHVPELGSVPILDKRPSLHQAISNTTANMLNAARWMLDKEDGLQRAPLLE